jgi:hypothetical protein
VAKLPRYTVRDCATLGMHFRDLYRDGELFAREVPAAVALWAVSHPEIFGGAVGADAPKLRARVLEQEYARFGSRGDAR